MVIPLFIAVIFLSSVLVVFTTSGVESNEARILIDFGQPGMNYDNTLRVGENVTALRVLSSYVSEVKAEEGNVVCVNDYCNTERGEWKFYKVESGELGFEETEIEESAENYVLQKEDVILFRYEYKTTEAEEEMSVLEEETNGTDTTS